MLVPVSAPATMTPEYFRTISLSDASSPLPGKKTRGMVMCCKAALKIVPLLCGSTLGTRDTASAG